MATRPERTTEPRACAELILSHDGVVADDQPDRPMVLDRRVVAGLPRERIEQHLTAGLGWCTSTGGWFTDPHRPAPLPARVALWAEIDMHSAWPVALRLGEERVEEPSPPPAWLADQPYPVTLARLDRGDIITLS
jgi:hypothetical protein